MSDSTERKKPSQNEYWEVSHAAGRLTSYACSLSARHIEDGRLRLQFNREVAYYMRGVVRDVDSGKRSVMQGLKAIWTERNSLLEQSTIMGGQAIGLAAGGLQIKGGINICRAGPALCIVGAGMVAHGVNNVYENGKNLITGSTDTKGPLREMYQRIAGSEAAGNITYGTVDISMTAGALMMAYRKPGAWRLFKYLRSDYQRGYELASKASLATDGISTGYTLYGMEKEVKNNGNE